MEQCTDIPEGGACADAHGLSRAAVKLCALFLMAGASPIYVRSAAKRFCSAFGGEGRAYILPLGVQVCVYLGGLCCRTACAYSRGTDLALYKKCCKALALAESGAAFYDVYRGICADECRCRAGYRLAGAALASGAFCLFFGGAAAECVAAVISGMLVAAPRCVWRHSVAARILSPFFGGLLCLLCYVIFCSLGQRFFLSAAVLGGIMPLIPGLGVCFALCDMLCGDFLGGGYRLLSALARAAAVSAAFASFPLLAGCYALPPVPALPLRAACAAAAAAGFAVLLGAELVAALPCVAVAAATYVCACLLSPFAGVFLSLFLASSAAGAVGRAFFCGGGGMCRVICSVPLVPGGALCLFTMALMRRDICSAAVLGAGAACSFAAVAFGLCLGECLAALAARILRGMSKARLRL